jgi:hypothetical protein
LDGDTLNFHFYMPNQHAWVCALPSTVIERCPLFTSGFPLAVTYHYCTSFSFYIISSPLTCNHCHVLHQSLCLDAGAARTLIVDSRYFPGPSLTNGQNCHCHWTISKLSRHVYGKNDRIVVGLHGVALWDFTCDAFGAMSSGGLRRNKDSRKCQWIL